MRMLSSINERRHNFNTFNSQRYKPKADMEKLRAEKREFLKEFSTKYGYNGKIDYIREEEYPQLRDAIYLDHTGATTFTKSAIINFHNDILNNLYGNPHSNSASSQASSMRIEGVRKRILNYFSANEGEYDVIFTQNATAAIKLAGEMFPWSENSTYKHLRESHNSVNGLRRFLEAINPDNVQGVTEHDVKEMLNSRTFDDECRYDDDDYEYERDDEITYNLFAYPAQCNYSGMRFPLNWITKIKRLNTRRSKTLVLLDAAAYVPSAQLSLADKDASPDFICLSFYKMFGFPTGLGALILKTELNPIIRKGYFGGGTINSVVYDRTWQEFSENIPTRYEDGTVNFLNIIALDHAFDAFEKIYGNIKNVSNHVTSLNTYLSRNMRSLRHWNGQVVCTINSDRDFSDSKKQGGIFSFNVKRSDGSTIGYIELDKLANTHGIHIRSGGNCNPGSLARWNGVTADDVIDNYAEGKHCNDDQDIYKGKLYGAARVSIGAMTTIEDILIWLDFFKRHYVEIMPGKTVHDLGSSKIPKDIGASKIMKYINKPRGDQSMNQPRRDLSMSSKSRGDLSMSKSREDVRASMFRYESPSSSPTSSQEDLRTSTLFKHENPPKLREASKVLRQVSVSKSHESLRTPTVYKYDYGSNPKYDDMRTSTVYQYEYGSNPKSREDLKYFNGLNKLSSSKSREDLKYFNGLNKLSSSKSREDLNGFNKLSSPKSREDLKSFNGINGIKYEYGSSSKLREDLASSKASKVQRYNNTNGNISRQNTIRNVKSLHVLTK
ncbi:hypothetical protein RclHR1_00400009 [Rhizophagus clarus]|uniref:Molybdenum cofactor sulfurase-like isoform X2 n=1 Tax=Rhizophagus clarus TaxID=94130 RepID=A0A2Z6RRP0_9GLOM|nr:hypothetical protein RclHR1_00400009 [Rhizophagus clarus]GES84027.1 molybdenum cofactor sulfurase-like isoform X2 [Rhizophagus clarus]